jgi:photosystem II stability/assembly factor-like uncharacterized protein
MAIGLSHGGSNIYRSPEPSTRVLVGTADGIALIERSSVGWRVAHRALTDQHISAIVFEPESGLVFAGAFSGPVYASADGALTWEERADGIRFRDVYSLATTRVNGRARIYAGTQPAHLFYSDDLGRAWHELPAMRDVPTVEQWSFPAPPHVAHTKFVTFDPVDPNVIYACIEQGALLKTEDGGQSWRELNSLGFYLDPNRKASAEFYDCHKAVVDPRDRNKIFVSGGAGLYVTADGGQYWERWTTPYWAEDVYPDALVMRPRDPDTLVVAAAEHNPRTWRQSHFAGGKVFRTRDGGRTWALLQDGWPASTPEEVGAMALEDWGDSFSVYAATTGGELYVSDDEGDHWQLALTGLSRVSKKGHNPLMAGR